MHLIVAGLVSCTCTTNPSRIQSTVRDIVSHVRRAPECGFCRLLDPFMCALVGLPCTIQPVAFCFAQLMKKLSKRASEEKDKQSQTKEIKLLRQLLRTDISEEREQLLIDAFTPRQGLLVEGTAAPSPHGYRLVHFDFGRLF